MPRRQRLVKERAKRLAAEMERTDTGAKKKQRDVLKAFNGSVRDIARAYTEVAFAELLKLATKSKSENMRLLSATAILERGWGKPAQSHVGGEAGDAPIQHVHRVERVIVKGKTRREYDAGRPKKVDDKDS